MTNKAATALNLTWLSLIVATITAALLGRREAIDSIESSIFTLSTVGNVNAIGLVVLSVAFFKVHLVIRYFMEINEAPRVWRLTFLAWVVGLFSTLTLIRVI